jgi:hypothetical protein
MLTHYTIFGERNSGTLYLRRILHSYLELQWTQRFGFKHWFIKDHFPRGRPNSTTDNECLEPLETGNDTLFIVIVRNPYDWCGAMAAKPYHIVGYSRASQYDFLSGKYLASQNFLPSDHGPQSPSPWYPEEGTNIYFIEEAENLVELRNLKNEHFYGLRSRVRHFHLVRQENLEEDIRRMVERFDLRTTRTNPLIDFQHPRQYGLEEKARTFIRSNLRNHIDETYY